MTTPTPVPPEGGLYEHGYGTSDLEGALRYWRQLGFEEVARGQLDAAAAQALYGHGSALTGVRLAHRAERRYGLVRLFAFERPAGPGLGFAHALALGSRWSGFYTRDLVQIQDAYRDEAAASGANWRVTDLARLFISSVTPGFFTPFVGIRESTILGPEHRHAFLQRVGFDRPGFGSFAADTPLPVTECTHGNVVIPSLGHSRFYTDALGLVVQTPTQQIDWTVTAVRHSLALREGEAFEVIVYQTPGVPSGFLRVYAPREPREDLREQSRPGQLGNCLYTYRYPRGSLGEHRKRLLATRASTVTPVLRNEFGEESVSCRAPDGSFWTFVAGG
jgi:catechol 2,3-dioxygenase-like lactoylglutathione lyase family enzyme